MCMQDTCAGLGLGQQVGVVTGVHAFMHLPIGACAHMWSQVHRPCRACRGTSFSCFQLPLLDKSVFFLSPKWHTSIYRMPAVCKIGEGGQSSVGGS